MLGENHVPSYGAMDADLMVIGQSPGKQEVKERMPFVGPSGELVDYMLDEAGLERGMVYIANALKCHPTGNRKGMAGELANCWRAWLHREIQRVDPRVILVLGADAHSSVLPPKVKFGHLVETESKRRMYLSSYHPGYFLRKGNIDGFISVGQKVKEILEKAEETI